MTAIVTNHGHINQAQPMQPECVVVRRDEGIAKPADAGIRSGRTQE